MSETVTSTVCPNALTEAEQAFLVQVLDSWSEGLIQAREETIKDRTIDEPEDLLRLLNGYTEEEALVKSILAKVVTNPYERNEGDAPVAV